MNKNTKKKKNSGSGLAAIIFLIALLSSRGGKLKEFFSGLQFDGETPKLDVSFGWVVAIVVALVIIIAITNAAAKVKKSERKTFAVTSTHGGTAAAHSHDRITGYSAGDCGDEEHWRKQLDGFLAAGIIDRSEYRVLLNKRKVSYMSRIK